MRQPGSLGGKMKAVLELDQQSVHHEHSRHAKQSPADARPHEAHSWSLERVYGAWTSEQVDMTRILSFFGHVDQRAATDHASAGYIVQSVFDYPTPLSGSPVHPASVSPYHSSDGVHSTTNRVVSGGRGGERMREGAIRIDGAAGAVRATEIDGAGEDATASSFHPRLLDHDSDAEGDTQARSWRERCRMHKEATIQARRLQARPPEALDMTGLQSVSKDDDDPFCWTRK
jgi:hypothetical protein